MLLPGVRCQFIQEHFRVGFRSSRLRQPCGDTCAIPQLHANIRDGPVRQCGHAILQISKQLLDRGPSWAQCLLAFRIANKALRFNHCGFLEHAGIGLSHLQVAHLQIRLSNIRASLGLVMLIFSQGFYLEIVIVLPVVGFTYRMPHCIAMAKCRMVRECCIASCTRVVSKFAFV